MSLELVSFIAQLLVALGAGLLAWAGLGFALSPLEILARRSGSELARRRRSDLERLDSTESLPPRLLYGLGAIPWAGLSLAASGAGVALSLFAVSPLLPLPLRLSGLLAGLGPLAARAARESRARRERLIEIRRLLLDLSVALRYEGTTGNALEWVARREAPGLARRRLRALVRAHLREPDGAARVLARLADDLRSAELARLVGRLSAARQGGASFDRALAGALEEVIAESETAADEAVEAAPEALRLPMIVALFAPALVWLVFPIGFFVLAQLAGVSPGPLK